MNQVRVLGDPVGASPASAVLRAFIRLAHDSGMRCALIALDGQPCAMPGDLAGCLVPAIAATAPILVFAPPPTAAAAASLARRRWPRACVVVVVRADARAEELLDRMRAELRWAGVEDPPHALAERELAPWLALGTLRANGPIVAVHDGDAESHVDAVFAAWKRHLAATGRRLRVIVTNSDPAVQASIAAAARGAAPPVEVVGGPFVPGCVEDASAVVLPWRRLRPTRNLVLALASGRPACVPALPSLAWLPVPRVAVPIEIDTGAGDGELAPAAVAAALDLALADGAAIGGNARTFVREELTRDRPAAPPLPRPDQSMVPAIDCVEPLVVLPRGALAPATART